MNIAVNYLAVIVAAVAGFLVGWGWYTIFGKTWMDALGRRKEDCKPTPLPFIIAGLASLLMAWMLAGLMAIWRTLRYAAGSSARSSSGSASC
jgi:Protein of unknown function (DUF1761)